MKNLDIITLVNSGVITITALTLDSANSYKVIKFRNAVRKALANIEDTEKSILSDLGISDPQEVESRAKELSEKDRTPEETKEFEELTSKIRKFNETRMEMLKEEVTLDGVKAMPYEQWHLLRKENMPKEDGKQNPINK